MFDTVDTTQDCVRIATGVVSTLKINPERMLAGLSADMLATDLAEYLVRKGTLHSCFLIFGKLRKARNWTCLVKAEPRQGNVPAGHGILPAG